MKKIQNGLARQPNRASVETEEACMRVYDIIQKKRDGRPLSEEEIAFVVEGFTSGEIPDYQISALLMAVFLNDMDNREVTALTTAMTRSGDSVNLSMFGGLTADKHSTGGVGDKTTLIVAPLVAALGGKVAKMSGRGLGHTGGTVDKLESIPGYKTTLTREAFIRQVRDVGVAVIGQSEGLAPADKKLYALRDVTATVDSIPLIASSIMSKKLASGSKNIVLDVKTGSGAFMKTLGDAKRLAETMVEIGRASGRNMTAVITNMDIPLGSAVGTRWRSGRPSRSYPAGAAATLSALARSWPRGCSVCAAAGNMSAAPRRSPRRCQAARRCQSSGSGSRRRAARPRSRTIRRCWKRRGSSTNTRASPTDTSIIWMPSASERPRPRWVRAEQKRATRSTTRPGSSS